MVEINYKTREEVEKENQTRERHSKSWDLADKYFGLFVGTRRIFSEESFRLKDFLSRKMADVNSEFRTITLYRQSWEDKIVSFAEKLKEEDIGEYTINAKYVNPNLSES